MNLRKMFALMTFAIAMAFGSSVIAQEQQAQQGQAQPPAEDINVSDQQLQQFADAQVEISSIQQEFSGRLQGVEDPEEAHELQLEANEQMTAAVEDAGLDVESFNQIAMAIQNDPELQQKLTELLEQ